MIRASIIKQALLWVFIAVIFLIPLVRWQGVFFPSVFTKTSLFVFLVELLFVLWLPLAIFNKNFRPGFSYLLLAVGLFLAAIFISAVFGVDFYKSFWSGYERMAGLWTYLHIFLFFLIGASVFKKQEDWNRIFIVGLVSAVLVALYGIFERFGLIAGSPAKIEATFGNSIFLGSYLMLFIFVALWFLFKTRPSWHSFFYVLSALILGVALLFTSARGPVLAFGAGGLFLTFLFAVFARREERSLNIANKHLKPLAFGLILLVLAGGILFFVMRGQFGDSSFPLLNRLAGISLQDRTVQARLMAWGVAFGGWKERPFLGWGWENFNILFDRHYDPRMFNQEPWWDRAHNFIFDIGATAGIAGLLAYLAIFASAFWALFKKRKSHFWAFAVLSSLLFAYLINNLFAFDTLTSLMPLFAVLAYVNFLSTPGVDIGSGKRQGLGFLAALIIAFLLVLPVFYFGAWKPFAQNKMAREGWDKIINGEDKAAYVLFDRALSYGSYGNTDVRRFVVEYVFEFLKRGGERGPQTMDELFAYSIARAEENIKANPQNVKWQMYAGQLYNLAGVNNPEFAAKAEERFLQAIKLSPGRPQNYMEVAQARYAQGNIEGMWEMVEAAIALLPGNPQPHAQAAVYAINLGDKQRENQEIEWLEQNSWDRINTPGQYGWHRPARDMNNLVEAYFKAGRLDKAIEFQNKLIGFTKGINDFEDLKSKEYFVDYYARLAALQQMAGKIEDARRTALYVLELDPSRRAEVEAFLQTLEQNL